MRQMKSQLFVLLFILHQCFCQQSSQQYSQQGSQYGQQGSQYSQQTQNKLEDIERDNLKSTQTQSSGQSPSQYLTFPQDQYLYNLPQQTAGLLTQPSTSLGQPQQSTPLIQPQQSGILPSAQQSPSLYTAQPTTPTLLSPQQLYVQPYLSQQGQSYPYVDFGGFPLYPGLYPYVVSQNGAQNQPNLPQVPANVLSEYYKSLQPAQVKTPALTPATKTSPATQLPNYLLPSAYYQPVTFTQPQNTQFFPYNSFYQVQSPQKSVYSAGIKSTTPSAPIKGKDDQFVPVNNGNYRYDFATAEQNYNKIRLTG